MEFKNKKLISIFEMFLLISMSFSFAYLFYNYHTYAGVSVSENESEFISSAREIILNYLGSNLVSAQEGLWTCPVNLQGSYCQEYIASECEDNCEADCLPSRADQTSVCATGTCIYDNGLSCSPNTPQLRCEDPELGIGGVWDEKSPGEIAQCQRGCCLIGSNAEFVTEAQCVASAGAIGADLDGTVNQFDAGITSELECLALANPLSEGACVYSEEVLPGQYNCDFTNKQNCLNGGGDFYEGYLCSNSELNTVCERQSTTSCVDGEDEVYWMDSCGNKENIYEGGSGSARDRSWNEGRVLTKEDSCVLGDSDNPVENQETCGNCNYLGGSVCGLPGENDEDPSEGEYVCRDLSCTFIDEFGQRQEKQHGESWCSYDTQIGTEGNGNDRRGVDVPGSSHYRNSCLEGEVRTESCLSGRREICVEENDNEIDFSSAACRLNQWSLCYELNQEGEDLDKCEELTDCVLKNVDLTSGGGDTFKFSMCVPKYPPGFEMRPDLDVLGSISGQAKSDGEIACGFASTQCKKIKVDGGLFGGDETYNDRCDDAEFTEVMNNLCMSLGDCGGSVNVVGEYTDEGYTVVNAPKLGNSYISVLRRLINAKPDQSAEALSQEEINSLYGVNSKDPSYDPETSNLQLIGAVTGLSGVALAYGVQAELFGAAIYGGATGTNVIGYTGLGGAASATSGALIGASVVSLLLGFTGGAGIPEEIQYALIVGGAIAGAIIGFNLVNSGWAGALAGGWFTFGLILGIVIIAVIIVSWLFGGGDVEEKIITFDCKPWQAPTGGSNCDKCGSDGLPCNEYKCESLGQTCELINEGTDEEICVDVSPDDVSAPIISSDENPLTEGYSYTGESSQGFNVVGPTSDGCLSAYTPVDFGIELDEPGQCKFSFEPATEFDSMEGYFGNSNLYRVRHATTINMPNLAALQGAGFDPDVRADFELYVKCSDRSGNENEVDYSISFCVAPEDDLTAPIISRFAPESGSYVAFDAEERNMGFFVNEPAECRWDKQDVDFEVMQNEVECNQDIESMSIFGFACQTNLPVDSDQNDYYIRCKDQPWLENDNPDGLVRNSNSESTKYELIRSGSPLTIEDIRPNDQTIFAGNVEFVELDLVVQTQGGATGTRRTCEYDFGNNGRFVEFFETGTDSHRQPLNLYFDNYEIGIRCEDEAGNSAEGSTQFSVELDSDGPVITRFYNLNGILHVITNEESECAYSFDSCGFNFEDGLGMSGFEFSHTTSFDTGLTYHVKCEDKYDNPSSCVAISGGLFD